MMAIDDLYITTREGKKRQVTWEELTQLEKDILWVFHHCVGDFHNPFIPDHSFKTRYWEYLRLNWHWFQNKTQARFYSQGVLIVLLCMIVEYVDTVSGNQTHFDRAKINDMIDCINDFQASSADEGRLQEIVKLAVDIAASMTDSDLTSKNEFKHARLEELHTQLAWVDKTFVKAYFKAKVE